MASLEDPSQTTRPQCEKGCGFSSYPATKNLRSMCFNDDNPINQKTTLPRIVTLKLSNNVSAPESDDHHLRLNVSSDDEEEDEVSDLKNKSCESFCENKVGFRGSRCRCGGRFCVVHLLPEEHACRYNRCKPRTQFFKENIQPAIRSALMFT